MSSPCFLLTPPSLFGHWPPASKSVSHVLHPPRAGVGNVSLARHPPPPNHSSKDRPPSCAFSALPRPSCSASPGSPPASQLPARPLQRPISVPMLALIGACPQQCPHSCPRLPLLTARMGPHSGALAACSVSSKRTNGKGHLRVERPPGAPTASAPLAVGKAVGRGDGKVLELKTIAGFHAQPFPAVARLGIGPDLPRWWHVKLQRALQLHG